MSEATNAQRDVGPLERFRRDTANEDEFFREVVRKLSGGATAESMCKDWKIPYWRLLEWILEEPARTAKWRAALPVIAEARVMETAAIAEAAPETKIGIAKGKFVVDTYFRQAEKLDPGRYLPSSKVNVSVEDHRAPVDRDALLLETARSLAYVLTEGARVKDAQRLALLPAPVVIEAEKNVAKIMRNETGPGDDELI